MASNSLTSSAVEMASSEVLLPRSASREGAYWRRALDWTAKGSLAVTDQGLFAGSNFLLNVLLARWLSSGDYGAFAVAYAAFLLLGQVHTALLTEPMLVFGPGKYAGQFREYVWVLLRGHFALTLPCAVLLAALGVILDRMSWTTAGHACLALSVAGPFMLLLWLTRRAFYVQLQPAWAAAGGTLYFLVLVCGVFWTARVRLLSPASAFLIMGAGSLAVSALLILRLRPQQPAEPTALRAAARDHWDYGRWALASAGASWFQGNIYFALLPAWVGLEEAGGLRALINLSNPAVHTTMALAVLLLPAFVRKGRQGGMASINRTLVRALGLFVVGSALYAALLWTFRSQVFAVLYGDKFHEYLGWPLLPMALLPVPLSAAVVLGSALRALERPDALFRCWLASSVVALVLGVPLAASRSAGGAAAGLLLSAVTMALATLGFYVKALRDRRKREVSELIHA
jgi:O-antigen/teichoic acid export membrane protein